MNMQSKKRVKKTIQSEASIEFNRWAKKLKVSSLWTEDTQEKKDFMERLRNARFARDMKLMERDESRMNVPVI